MSQLNELISSFQEVTDLQAFELLLFRNLSDPDAVEVVAEHYQSISRLQFFDIKSLILLKFLFKFLLMSERLLPQDIVKEFDRVNNVYLWAILSQSMLQYLSGYPPTNSARVRICNLIKSHFNRNLKMSPKFWELVEFQAFLSLKQAKKPSNFTYNQKRVREIMLRQLDLILFFDKHPSYLPANFDFRQIVIKFICSCPLKSQFQKECLQKLIHCLLRLSQNKISFILPSFRVAFQFCKFEYFADRDKFFPVRCFNELINRLDQELFILLVRETLPHIRSNQQQRFNMFVNLTKLSPSNRVTSLLIQMQKDCLNRTEFKLLLRYAQSILPLILHLALQPKFRNNTLQLMKVFILGSPCSETLISKISSRLLAILQKQPEGDKLQVLLRMMEFIAYKYKDSAQAKVIHQMLERFIKSEKFVPSDQQQLSAIIGSEDWAKSALSQQQVTMSEGRPGFRGLVNIGNTCYMNSFMQALFVNRQFRQRIFNLKLSQVLKPQQSALQVNNFKAVYCLQKLFILLYKSKRSAINPRFFKDTLPQPFNKSFFQQDSSEFGRIYLDFLQKMLKKTSDSNILNDFCTGKLRSTTTCLDCNSSFSRVEGFMDLCLPAPDSMQACEVESRISDYFQQQILQKENSYLCQHCGKLSSRARKSLVIQRLPNHLILTLNRFKYDSIVKRRIKLNYKVAKAESVSLKPYVFEPQQTAFHLYAVIIHKGPSAESGHYISYGTQDYKDWFKFDDSRIQKVSGLQIQNDSYSTPYMLFYQRQDGRRRLVESSALKEEFKLNQHFMSILTKDELDFLQESKRKVVYKGFDLSKIRNLDWRKDDQDRDPGPAGFSANKQVY